ncbi:MAG: hypothetical protein JJU29_08040 [Verrucomicrobia bacterium]|nr:hypothetical protein [Verrucomicrobiota bacterium]MCH8511885.1 hypothetical protein [Kiritimatiellia bacterium]
MTIRTKLATFALPALLLLAIAPAQAANPGGTHAQVAFADWSDLDNGFNLAGSFKAQENLRLFASYTNTDLDHLRVGAGWLVPLEPGFDLEFGGSINYFDIGPVDDTGLGIHAIARITPIAELTVSGKLEYILLDDFDNETVLGIDVDYLFQDNISGFLNYSIYNEIDNNLILIGARLRF